MFERSKIDEILNRLNSIEGNIHARKRIISTKSEKWIQFDYVPGEVIIRDTTPDCIGRICVIGEHINEDVLRFYFRIIEVDMATYIDIITGFLKAEKRLSSTNYYKVIIWKNFVKSY